PAVPWLTVTSGSGTPGVLSIGLTNAALTLSAAGSPYSAAVVVTCTSSICGGKSQTVSVVLTVTSAPPQLSLGSSLLSFTASTANPQASTLSLEIRNAGGGSLTGTSATTGASWLTVGAVPAQIASGPGAQVSVTANPAGLKAGYYRGTITVVSSAGNASVPVTLLVSADSIMTLGPAGSLLTAPEGGPLGKSNGSFLVSVNSSTGAAYSAAVQPGANWLIVGAGSGTASSTSPGTVGFSINPTVVAGLKAGAYYGTIRVSAAAIVNAPQDYQVVLNIVPGNRPALPDPQPAGLLFLTTAGAGAPPAQVVTLYASSTTAVGFQAAADGAGWLSVSPSNGSTSASTASQLSVMVDQTGLKAGVYRGGVNVSYSGTSVRTVNVTLVVQPAVAAALGALTSQALPHDVGPTCAGGQLVPTQTGLVNSFAAPASWPTPLAIRLVDTCGSVISNGQIVATFSNGDPPLGLTLVDGKTGLYSATWTPRRTSQQVTINARATASGYATATAQLAGQVIPNEAPTLEPNGALDVFNPLVGGSLGPGNIVQIYGSRLASQAVAPAVLPLPTTVFGTKVLIGGVAAPLFYVSPGQVNAQVPFELTAGKQYQVIVSANGALTTPQPIQLNQATPATLQFTSGLIIAQHQDGSLILDTAPSKPGEFIVFYMSGLGATDIEVPSGQASPQDPPARVKDTPVVTLNGNTVDVAFAGLTPGLVGLYQINLQVPVNLADGTYQVVVSQSGTPGNTTTLTVHQ
ncbi:MAG TPA: hypothetical protein VNH18_27690, partial [Bryobacteraceae bacterium]|nr:hypothetical protein [Bryobacteraceae bacterium]